MVSLHFMENKENVEENLDVKKMRERSKVRKRLEFKHFEENTFR